MKILFIVNVDWFFVSHRLPIALGAIAAGEDVHIAAKFTDKLTYLASLGIACHPIALDRSDAGVQSIFQSFSDIRGVVKIVQPDLIHLVTVKPVLLGGIAARLMRVPSVVVAISGLGYIFTSTGFLARVRRYLVSILYRIVLGHQNIKVIFQNIDDKNQLVRATDLEDFQVAVIRGSGADLTSYVNLPLVNKSPVVMIAARLLIDKGVRVFVEAVQHLQRDDEVNKLAPRFVIVGEPDIANPQSLTLIEINQWVSAGIVEYWGFQADMPAVLAQATIVTLPSYYGEGLPKVLIEAAACGRPVITTDHPGCRDAIEPGITGLLVPIKDSVALANAIKALLLDTKRCQEMGSAGRKFAEREFDVRSVVDKHLKIYNELHIAATKVVL